MTDFIRKITFDYIKKDGEESVRNIIAPKFLKESFNSFTEIDKEQVNYVSGFEINTDDLESDEIVCPNITKGVTCIECKLCNGNQSGAKNIVVKAHGVKSKRKLKKIK